MNSKYLLDEDDCWFYHLPTFSRLLSRPTFMTMEHRNFFGNNMSAMIPPDFTDVSKLREIPDNQEVFTHSKTDQSIILEILEYVQEPDEEAIRTHLDDMSNSNESTDTKIDILESIPLEEIEMENCESAYYLSSQQLVSKFNENARNCVDVHLALFRLPEFDTDILLSFNDPTSISPQSSSHGPVPVASQPWDTDQFRQMICSLKILNTDFLG